MCPAHFKRKEDGMKKMIKTAWGGFFEARFIGNGDSPSSNCSLLEIREVHVGGGWGGHTPEVDSLGVFLLYCLRRQGPAWNLQSKPA